MIIYHKDMNIHHHRKHFRRTIKYLVPAIANKKRTKLVSFVRFLFFSAFDVLLCQIKQQTVQASDKARRIFQAATLS